MQILSSVAYIQPYFRSFFDFCFDFLFFMGGSTPPWIRLGSNPASWGELPPLKTSSGGPYEYSGRPPPWYRGVFADLKGFHGVDLNGGTPPHEEPCCFAPILFQWWFRLVLEVKMKSQRLPKWHQNLVPWGIEVGKCPQRPRNINYQAPVTFQD